MRILESVFSPRSIAVVGASSNPRARVNQNFLQPLLDLGFKGKIYPINPHVTELMGQKAYASVRDVPDTVEQVVCCLPARMTPKVIEDCAAARVKVVIFYSAGLAETGEEVGVELQREVVEIARRGGVRIIGPNCLGVHCPGAGITFESNGRRQSGHVSFLSQSGGNAREIILLGAQRGVLFSKGISYGNAADLNETDFLECFASDADTAIIAAYIEGIKEPRRFLDALTRATAAKPVVVLKGGKTHGGTRAVNSHTGALAGSTETWNALCQQRNVIQVG
ncbi:MAG: CoA-binding protein, partial [Chloroflexi bacterium]|nr:CoA-binding protein [Chloroflexota bacterium]